MYLVAVNIYRSTTMASNNCTLDRFNYDYIKFNTTKGLQNCHFGLEYMRKLTFEMNKGNFPSDFSTINAVNLGMWSVFDKMAALNDDPKYIPEPDCTQCIHCYEHMANWISEKNTIAKYAIHSIECNRDVVKNINSNYPALECYMINAVWMFQNFFKTDIPEYEKISNMLDDRLLKEEVANDLLRLYVPGCTIADLTMEDIYDIYCEINFIKRNAYCSITAHKIASTYRNRNMER